MTNRNKAKGTSAESAVRDYLRSLAWPHAKRLTLTGAKDPGDVSLGDAIPVTVEVKHVRAMALSAWVSEAQAEAANNGHRVWLVWHKRATKGHPRDWYVTTSGEVIAHLLEAAGYVPGYTAPAVEESAA